MKLKTWAEIVAIVGLLAACAHASPWDNPYTLDLPDTTADQMLRNDDPTLDRPLSDCKVEVLPSGKKQYPCVAHFVKDYQAMLTKISGLEDQLKEAQAALLACQAGTPGTAPSH